MTVTGQNGIFGFGIQSSKGVLATTWYRHRANDINFGPIQDLRLFPLEVGGIVTPTGPYKAGVFVGGGATIQPRLEGDFGWLLKGLMGDVSTSHGTADADAVHAAIQFDATSPVTTGLTDLPSARRLLFTATGVTDGNITITSIEGTDDSGAPITDNTPIVITGSGTGVSAKAFKTVTSVTFDASGVTAGSFEIGYYLTNTHTFKFASDPTSIPWMSFRKAIPGSSAFGEIGKDCKLASARIVLPQTGILQARLDVVGREPSWQEGEDVGDWTFAGAYEDWQSVAATCVLNGYIKLPEYSASPLPMTGLTVQFTNNLTSPQQEMIIGSPYPDDFAILSRAMSLQAVLKWPDAALYKKILADSNLAWEPTPYVTDFQAKVLTPSPIPGDNSSKYSIQIDAAAVMWQVAGPPEIAGGEMVQLPLIGQVIDPGAGSEYCTFTVVNEQYDYA